MALKVGIHEAKTNLSRLIPLALAGEEVIIAKFGHPLVRLVPVQGKRGRRALGIYAGKIKVHGDLLEPLPESIIRDFWLDPEDNEISS